MRKHLTLEDIAKFKKMLEDDPNEFDEDAPFTYDELLAFVKEEEANYPKREAKRKLKLEQLYRVAPDRCGQIDFENNTVDYNDEIYTKSYGNFEIEELEDILCMFDIIGLDYELRIDEYIDGVFTFFIPDTEEEGRKISIFFTLSQLYMDYYRNLLKENGIDIWKEGNHKYVCPWTGCEKEIEPERYSDEKLLLSKERRIEVLIELYAKACEKAAVKPIFEIKFEKEMTNEGEKKMCKAKMDIEHWKNCSKDGFNIKDVNIAPDNFVTPCRKEIESGREIYYFEFLMDGTE